MAREDLVLAKVKKILKAHHCYHIRGNPSLGTGTPDIIACVGGLFCGIECKDDMEGKYKVTEAQSIVLRKIEESGGRRLVVDKKNIGEFEEWVSSHAEKRS